MPSKAFSSILFILSRYSAVFFVSSFVSPVLYSEYMKENKLKKRENKMSKRKTNIEISRKDIIAAVKETPVSNKQKLLALLIKGCN